VGEVWGESLSCVQAVRFLCVVHISTSTGEKDRGVSTNMRALSGGT